MKLSVLVASHTSRVDQLQTLLDSLALQLTPEVEVVVLRNRGSRPIGDYRRMLLEDAHGDYVCYVDDDDRVPDYYVADILTALGADYVGFEVQVTDIAGQIGAPGRQYLAVHSLRFDRWHQKGSVFYRHVSHLNPVRRELALQGEWSGDYAEDHRWADSVKPLVRTERFIPKVMYFYDFNHGSSLRGNRYDPHPYPTPLLPEGVRLHPDSED